MPARLRLANGIDGEQRGLGLDVVHVAGIVDASVAHRGLNRLRDLLDHRRPADILGQELRAQCSSDRQARFRGGAGPHVAGEHRRVRGDDAVAAARPHHGDRGDLRVAALAVPLQRPAKGLVGQNSREVVHAAIAFGLADDGDDLVRGELAAGDAGLETRRVLNRL